MLEPELARDDFRNHGILLRAGDPLDETTTFTFEGDLPSSYLRVKRRTRVSATSSDPSIRTFPVNRGPEQEDVHNHEVCHEG